MESCCDVSWVTLALMAWTYWAVLTALAGCPRKLRRTASCSWVNWELEAFGSVGTRDSLPEPWGVGGGIATPQKQQRAAAVLPRSAEAAAFGALAPAVGAKPWGVLLRLSSRPSSLRGALGAASSSGICFWRRRFLLHSSWQSCQSGRLRTGSGGGEGTLRA